MRLAQAPMPDAGTPRVGQKAEVEITGLGEGGEGVGRIEGMTAFIPGVMPGDLTLAEVTEVRKNFCRARVRQILRPSPHRVAPPCAVADECGGCQIQHIDYQEQLRLKTQSVRDALRRIGRYDPGLVLPTLGCRNPWEYRNKAQFPVGLAPASLRASDGRFGQRVVAGCYARGTHQIIDTDLCLIQHPTNNRTLTAAKRLIGEFGYTVYDEKTGRGLIRHVLARTGLRTGQAMAVLVTNGETIPRAREFARRLMDEVPGISGVLQNINTRQTNVILGERTRVLAGAETIEDIIGGLRFKISARSFFQVNTEQTEVIYRQALEYAGITVGDAAANGNGSVAGAAEPGLPGVVVDAYCGIGTITLMLAKGLHRRGGLVYGVEVVPEAIEDAQANAKLNGIDNVEFRCGQVEKIGPQLLEEGVRPDVVVVDPPRRGCERAVLETFAAMAPRRIVYVSCNPSTLARDLAYLRELGYEAREVQPVDMFPQTWHVEAVILLQNTKR